VPKPSVPALPSHHARQLNMVSVVLTVTNGLHELPPFTKRRVVKKRVNLNEKGAPIRRALILTWAVAQL
jgi:hypothetical protein